MSIHPFHVLPPRAGAERRRRGGLVSIAALVCLMIVTSIIASILQHTLRARRQLRMERDRRQVELLVAAGASRAANLLGSEPAFRGDTWNLAADAIVGNGNGRVTTEIIRIPNNDGWQVNVAAEYPLDRDFPIRRTRSFPITSPSNSFQEQTP